MTRCLAPAIALLVVLAPAMAHAQVNIDQGKSPAQIYTSDCADCHSSSRGMAKGRGASALTSFLTEHYTSSAEEAASVAAYVLGGGGGEQQQTGRRGPNTGIAARTHRQAAPPVPSKPTIVVVVPDPPVTPSPAPSAAAEEPVESQPVADAPVPRDNIPD